MRSRLPTPGIARRRPGGGPLRGSAAVALLLSLGSPEGGMAAPAVSTLELSGEHQGSCTLRSADPAPVDEDRLHLTEGGRVRWAARTGDELTCTGAFEPLDREVPEGEEGKVVEVELLEARAVRIHHPGVGGAVRVEWRSPAGPPPPFTPPDDGASALLAERQLAWDGDRSTLGVAARPRWLRVFRADASPVTVAVDSEDPSPEVRLPAPSPGGEVFGTLGSVEIAPVALLLDGRERIEVRPGGAFSLPGIAPGDHRLVPVYRGGLSGSPRSVTVRAGRTTELHPLPLEEVAGLEYALPPEACPWPTGTAGGPRTARISRLERSGDREAGSATPLHDVPLEEGECSGIVAGLPPGEYAVAGLDGDGEVVASARVELTAGEVSQVLLAAGRARVHGEVTFGDGQPLADLRIEFAREGTLRSAVTDARGRYEVALPAPGLYRVALKATRFMPLEGFERRIREGDQELDLHLDGGVIGLEIETLDGSEIDEPVQVELQPETGSRTVGFLLPDEGFEQSFPGLDFGRYEVRAYSTSGWTSDSSVEVLLSEDEPFAEVRLLLRRNESVLRLVDPSGRPVTGASVQAGIVMLAARAPGVFELAGAAPGQRLEIQAAGFSPVCRILEGTADLTVTLTPARGEALIVFPEAVAPHGSVLGLPGSSCPVRDDLLGGRVTRAEGGSGLTLRGLPEGEYVFLQEGVGSVRFSVPGPPAVLEAGRAGDAPR